MGVEDRDRYRDESAPEWKRAETQTRSGTDAPGKFEWVRTRRPFKALAVAIVLLEACSLLWLFRGVLPGVVDAISPQQATLAAVSSSASSATAPLTPPPPNVVRLVATSGFDTPSPVVVKWWVDVSPIGRVTVYVPAGETPRQALTAALTQRGYQVVVVDRP
jgi:hypothetical protein